MKALSVEKTYLYVKLSSLIRTGKISVITGAGISTSSGIPDFRSKNGLFKEIKDVYGYSGEQIFTYSVVHSSEKARDVFLSLMCKLKEKLEKTLPTETHKMLAYLEKKHKTSIYTQNIDGLEKKAGIEKNLVYLHGNIFTLVCTHCRHTTEYTLEVNEKIKKDLSVLCPKCSERKEEREKKNKRSTPVGVLLPNILLYGDASDSLSVIKRMHYDRDVSILLVMGTSLRVYGVRNLTKEISKVVSKNNGIKVYVGKEAPPKSIDPYFDYWIEGECDVFSSNLMSALNGGYLLKELRKMRAGKVQEMQDLLSEMRRLSLEPSSRVE